MSAEKYGGGKKSIEYGRLAGEVFVAGIAGGVAGVAGPIATRYHRELTHDSVKVPRLAQRVFDFEQRTLGVGEPTVWASVHRVHHQMTDVNLYGFYKLSRAMKWAEAPQNRDKLNGVSIPESFKHLDPFVDSFSREEVMEIGGIAEKVVEKRLADAGEAYDPPSDYKVEELEKLFNPEKPNYFYLEKKKHKEEWSQDEIAEVLLTDPHSPAFVDRENGVHGVALKNVGLYMHAADLFRDRPDLKPKDLQNEDGGNRRATKLDIAAGVAIPAAAVLFRRGQYKPRDFAIAAAAGGAIYGVKAATEIFGGNVTNSMGHAGVLDLSHITQAAFNKKFEIKLNEDGSLATDTVHAGFLGRALSIATLDEVGGQQVHHAHPEKIAYTMEEGWKGRTEAPFGSFLKWLTERKKIRVLKSGDNFKDEEVRPDVPHEVVIMIQNARVKQRDSS